VTQPNTEARVTRPTWLHPCTHRAGFQHR